MRDLRSKEHCHTSHNTRSMSMPQKDDFVHRRSVSHKPFPSRRQAAPLMPFFPKLLAQQAAMQVPWRSGKRKEVERFFLGVERGSGSGFGVVQMVSFGSLEAGGWRWLESDGHVLVLECSLKSGLQGF